MQAKSCARAHVRDGGGALFGNTPCIGFGHDAITTKILNTSRRGRRHVWPHPKRAQMDPVGPLKRQSPSGFGSVMAKIVGPADTFFFPPRRDAVAQRETSNVTPAHSLGAMSSFYLSAFRRSRR